jgi:thiol-disulfide isomerase/thioredoxin
MRLFMNAPEPDSDLKPARSRRLALIAFAAIAGLIAGAAGVYFMRSGDGNATLAADCGNALAAASRAAPLAKGEVAAFRPASEPQSLADLAFKSPEGADLTLASFAGKATLVNLWATWCVPCREEMPALDKLEAELGSDAFQVVAINIDIGSEAKARAFLDEIGVKDLRFYSDPTSKVFRNLKGRGLAFGLPTTLLVDAKGCRIGSVEGPAAWDSNDAKALIKAAIGS